MYLALAIISGIIGLSLGYLLKHGVFSKQSAPKLFVRLGSVLALGFLYLIAFAIFVELALGVPSSSPVIGISTCLFAWGLWATLSRNPGER